MQGDRLPVAVVTARYPPMDSTGTIRVGLLRDHLPDHGIDPVVVTLPAAWARAQGRLTGPVPASERGVLRPSAPSDPIVRAATRVPLLRRFQRWLLRPDVLVLWARSVPRRVVADLPPVAAVYATGPPFSSLEAGRRMAARLGVPFVVELRDPPGLDRSTGGLGRVGDARVAAFARRTLGAADAVVVVTPAVKRHLLDTYPGAVTSSSVTVVPNSAPADGTPPAVQAVPEPAGRLTLAYVGSLRGADDWDLLRSLAAALETLDPPGRLRLVGAFPAAGLERLAPDVEKGTVVPVGRVDRRRALAEMAAADGSLVFVGADEGWWIGRKVLESLGVARRILAFTPPGDTADLLAHSAKSRVLDRRAVDAAVLRDALAWLRTERVPGAAEPRVPDDRDLAAAVAATIRSAADGEPAPPDWTWG